MSDGPSPEVLVSAGKELLLRAFDAARESAGDRLFPNGIDLVEFHLAVAGASLELKIAGSSASSGSAPSGVLFRERLPEALEPSGRAWCVKFPGSTRTTDLIPSFRTACDNFIGAMRAAGAKVTISATYRPAERAYLMHWSWLIAREGSDPTQVPPMLGVNIEWVHHDAAGNVDMASSRGAAEDMVTGYAMKHNASLTSNHIKKCAIDMTISWTGTLTIKNADGASVTITSTPRNGGNKELHAVGATYGVIKLISDPPHWSADGHR
jgi:hypothetical protein